MSKLETLNYTIEIGHDSNTATHTLDWTIPEFQDTIWNKDTLLSEKAETNGVDPSGRMFRLKITEFGTEGEHYEFYYSSVAPVFILKMTWHYRSNNKTWTKIPEDSRYHNVKSYESVYHMRLCTMSSAFQGYLQDKQLRFKVDFFMVNPESIKCMVSNTSNRRSNPWNLKNDLQKLINAGSFSDAVIKSIDGDEFKVHKVLLASRSDVLRAHFEHNTAECQNNIIETPFESKVIKEVISFVYCDKALRVNEMPETLLAVADFYQLFLLKTLCEEALLRKLSAENAIEILQLAELHSAQTLEQKTLTFIKENHRLVYESNAWKKLQSITLLKKVSNMFMHEC